MIYLGIGLAFPLLAYIVYPDWSVFYFTGLVLVLAVAIEIVYKNQGIL